jgi:ethanolamine utilization protein EutJ
MTEAETRESAEAREEGRESLFPYDADRVKDLLAPLEASLKAKAPLAEWKKLYLGFDLGTTNTVLVALNEEGAPVAAEMESSGASVRDGVVVDYLAAINAMRKCLERVERRLGRELIGVGAAAYPPGISERTARVCANVVESLGFICEGLYEEPTAAADALLMSEGAIVDIGGGTTGISILREGKVVYSADEPTGGTHMTLVLAGAQGVDFDKAEMMKRDIANHPHLVPLLRPTLEKMATIVKNHLKASGHYGKVPILTVGGGAALPGAEEVLSDVVGFPVYICPHPLMVTPAGIAARLWREKEGLG